MATPENRPEANRQIPTEPTAQPNEMQSAYKNLLPPVMISAAAGLATAYGIFIIGKNFKEWLYYEKHQKYEPLTEEQAGEITSIFNQNRSRLFGYCYSRLRNAQDAEETVSDTFYRLLRRFGSLHPHETAGWGPLLFTTAGRLMKNRFRDNKRRRVTDFATVYNHQYVEMEEILTQDTQDIEQTIADQEKNRALYQAINALIPSYREIILLKIAGEMNNPEIAATLNTTVGAVKSRYHRALSALKKELGNSDYFSEESEIHQD